MKNRTIVLVAIAVAGFVVTAVTIGLLIGVLIWLRPVQSSRPPIVQSSQPPMVQAPRSPAPVSNTPPRIVSVAPEYVERGKPYVYQVLAKDDQAQRLTFFLDRKPSGMTIQPETGRIDWMAVPPYESFYEVVVRVSDELGAEAREQFVIRLSSLIKVGAVGDEAQFVTPLDGGLLAMVTQARLKIVRQENVNDIVTSYWTAARTARMSEYFKGFLYLLQPYKGIDIFDLREPKNIRLVSRLHTSPNVGSIDLSGDKLFVPDSQEAALRVFSLKHPDDPVEIARQPIPDGARPHCVRIAGDVAYVIADRSLMSFDIANLNSIQPLGEVGLPAPDGLGALVVLRDHAYVFHYHSICVFDVQHPSAMRSVGIASNMTFYSSAVLRGDRFIGYGENGVCEFDCSYPVAPRRTAGLPSGILISKSTNFFVNANGRMEPLQASSHPKSSPRKNPFPDAWQIKIAGGIGYLIGGEVTIWDFTNREPRQISSIGFGGHNYMPRTQVAAVGRRLYMSNGIIDASDPKSPRNITGFTGGTGIGVGDGLAIISKGRSLEFWDVAGSEQALLRATRKTEEELGRLMIVGNVLFGMDSKGTLHAYRIQDDSTVTQIGQLKVFEWQRGMVLDLALEGDFLYLALNDAGIACVDIQHPEQMQFHSWFDTSQHSEAIRVHKGIAYVADGSGGVVVIDMRRKGEGTVIGQHVSTDWTRAVEVANDYVYSCDGQGGLSIFRAQGLIATSPPDRIQ